MFSSISSTEINSLCIISPIFLAISFFLFGINPNIYMTEKMLIAILDGDEITPYLYNDLEYAVFDDYKELQMIKSAYPQAVMSGSGSTYFILENLGKSSLGEDFEFINNLKFVSQGVGLAD